MSPFVEDLAQELAQRVSSLQPAGKPPGSGLRRQQQNTIDDVSDLVVIYLGKLKLPAKLLRTRTCYSRLVVGLFGEQLGGSLAPTAGLALGS